MTPNMDIDELIARPLDVIARLRAELKARPENDVGDGQGAPVATVISKALCEGDSPALERVPVLSRESLAEVCLRLLFCTWYVAAAMLGCFRLWPSRTLNVAGTRICR